MTFNGLARKQSLSLLHQYVPSSVFTESVGWKRGKGGCHWLVDQTLGTFENSQPGADTVCIVVGKVSESRLNVTPIGSFNPRFPPLKAAKFQLTLSEPFGDVDFHPDFTTAVAHLEEVQRKVALVGPCKNLIETEGTMQYLRFSAPIFQARVSNLPLSSGSLILSNAAAYI